MTTALRYPARYHESIYWRTTGLHDHFAGKRIFVVGHTGFYGGWFLDYFNYLRLVRGLDVTVIGGSRATRLNVLDRDTFPTELKIADYVINCAGDSNGGDLGAHVYGPAKIRLAINRSATLLQFSSGASGGNTDYGWAKSIAEKTLLPMDLPTQIVRPFATVGPGMGLDKPFAISAFIKAHLAGQPLKVTSAPVVRSFCHITDLLVQCLHVMVHGDGGPYEVGSDDPVTIEQAARAISDDVVVTDGSFPTNAGRDIYYADLSRVRSQFNVDLDIYSISSILDTARYYEAAKHGTDSSSTQNPRDKLQTQSESHRVVHLDGRDFGPDIRAA